MFPLTGIEVEGVRWVSPDLIRSESGLAIDGSYTEADLRSARDRIARLPFVLDVDFSLRKGKVYGTYTLMIGVVETMPLVFRMQYVDADSQRRAVDAANAVDSDERALDEIGDWSIGGRWFLGSHGMVYASLRLLSEDLKFDLAPGKPVDFGFTHYNLFNRRVFFNLNFQWTDDFEDSAFDLNQQIDTDVVRERPILPSLTLAVPLKGNHWLSFSADYFEQEQFFEGRRDRFQERFEDERLRLKLGWFFDSTDDGVLPTAGRRIESAFEHDDFSNRLDSINPFPDRPGPGQQDRNFDRQLWVGRWDEYVQFHQRVSGFLNVSGEVRLAGEDRIDILMENEAQPIALPINDWDADVGARIDVLGDRFTEDFGELRLDISAGWGIENAERVSVEETRFELFMTWRNRWGLVRLGFVYEDFEESRRDGRRRNPRDPRDPPRGGRQ